MLTTALSALRQFPRLSTRHIGHIGHCGQLSGTRCRPLAATVYPLSQDAHPRQQRTIMTEVPSIVESLGHVPPQAYGALVGVLGSGALYLKSLRDWRNRCVLCSKATIDQRTAPSTLGSCLVSQRSRTTISCTHERSGNPAPTATSHLQQGRSL